MARRTYSTVFLVSLVGILVVARLLGTGPIEAAPVGEALLKPTERLIAKVEAFADAGDVTPAQAEALSEHLKAAIADLRGGEPDAAVIDPGSSFLRSMPSAMPASYRLNKPRA